MLVKKLRTRQADDEDRRVTAPADEVLDELEERGLSPLKVVEGDDERPIGCELFEQAAHGPVGLLDRTRLRADADCSGDASSDALRIVIAVEQLFDVGL